jgi:hypothetical protein
MYLKQNMFLGYVVFSYSVLKNYGTCNVISQVVDFVLLPISIIIIIIIIICYHLHAGCLCCPCYYRYHFLLHIPQVLNVYYEVSIFKNLLSFFLDHISVSRSCKIY